MNKHLFMAAVALVAGASALSAQTQLLKQAEKSGGKPADVVKILTPAFSDPETSKMSQTYMIPANAFFKEYDELFGFKQLGKTPEGGDKKMSDDLLEGYAYYMKALSVDTVVDAKGKVKAKNSGKIINALSGHANDFNNAALSYWELKEYNNAYRAWDAFLGFYEDPRFQGKIVAQADTVLGEIYFNQALAAWQADSLQNALGAFANAQRKGYGKKQLYDYAMSVASLAKDQDAVIKWASEGNAKYGAEDPNYLGNIINVYLQNKEFDKAFNYIDKAIAAEPGNAQYYVIKGILYENQEKKPEAKEMFLKAVTLDPQNQQANSLYGASLCQEAYKLSDEAPTSAAEYQAYFDSKIKPLFIEATKYLEKAYTIDPENSGEALRYLDNIYYNLHDEKMQEDVKRRQGL